MCLASSREAEQGEAIYTLRMLSDSMNVALQLVQKCLLRRFAYE
jgi:hypothetical protein